MDLDSLKADDIHSIATLSSTQKYQDALRMVDEEVAKHGDAMPDSWAGPSDADPVYRLIVTCNELAMSVDDEITKTHAFIKQKCATVTLQTDMCCSMPCLTKPGGCTADAAGSLAALFLLQSCLMLL